ncbi:hypothetical protein [Pedobacter sp.]|jgi:hypothetical protein|uniref:hypothetical protein n=1 Tax=Pedobacter sp. TaxID=1411316 RepID=UPI002B5ECFD6|nr:hypothetical protein [Pedobacter sp.]HWW40271.1 hypothetical protein [Pedobacter sp.]
MTQHPENKKDEEKKKTVYKETEDPEQKKDEGESSSGSDLSRTDLISKPDRKNKPLGSSHEPGTMPGSGSI